MATIYLYKFNNYYNRQVKKLDTIEEYGSYAYVETGNNVNFNPSDGVNTQHTFGRQNNPYNGDCDYLIYCQDNINITSRWFIVEQNRIRVGQYGLALRRDVMVDNYDDIVSAPCFIEKATLRDDDVLIYNKEEMAVNQIKQQEVWLKDATDVAWICGYMPRDYAGGPIEFNAYSAHDIEVDDIEDWEYYDKVGVPIHDALPMYMRALVFKTRIQTSPNTWSTSTIAADNGFIGEWSRVLEAPKPSWSEARFAQGQTADNIASSMNIPAGDAVRALIPDTDVYLTGNYVDSLTEIKSLSGKVIKDGNGVTYRIGVSVSNESVYEEVSEDKTGVPLWSSWRNLIASRSGFQEFYPGSFKGYLYTSAESATITLTPMAMGTYKTTMPNKENRYHLKDAPYDMFCIPFPVGKEVVKVKSTGDSAFSEISISAASAMTMAQGIAEAVGTANIYDLQLLPYCPMTGFDLSKAKSEDTIDIQATDSKRYTLITNAAETENRSVILWSLASQGTFNINHEIEVGNKKIENQTDKYRIVSPNYNGTFEFNAAYNDGIDFFNIDYTYLPYNSYIHVNPNFKNLYGNDYDDARGLICQGDFSISYLSDAWANYQVSNKNFANTFNRGIQNMETNNRVGNEQKVVAGAIGAIATGLQVGAQAGVVAGIGAAAMSGVGLAADMHYTRELQNEALDYSKDMFGYNLQNIQALPDSIARTTAYTANNKVFPILEHYTCKPQEREILAQKIAWNGMTVMAIGTIGQYINNNWSYEGIEDKGYVKGRLIRLEGLHDDTHMLNAIADEIYRGGYFK